MDIKDVRSEKNIHLYIFWNVVSCEVENTLTHKSNKMDLSKLKQEDHCSFRYRIRKYKIFGHITRKSQCMEMKSIQAYVREDVEEDDGFDDIT